MSLVMVISVSYILQFTGNEDMVCARFFFCPRKQLTSCIFIVDSFSKSGLFALIYLSVIFSIDYIVDLF